MQEMVALKNAEARGDGKNDIDVIIEISKHTLVAERTIGEVVYCKMPDESWSLFCVSMDDAENRKEFFDEMVDMIPERGISQIAHVKEVHYRNEDNTDDVNELIVSHIENGGKVTNYITPVYKRFFRKVTFGETYTSEGMLGKCAMPLYEFFK